MAIDPFHVVQVRKYEPILYFSPGEAFFPSDAKRYLEQCALWRASPPLDDKQTWGMGAPGAFPRQPMIPYGKIAALSSEVRPGDTFLGASPFLTSTDGDNRFLDLAGWFTPVGPGTNLAALNQARTVTATSENRFASLLTSLGAAALYDFSHEVIPDSKLKGSRFWYHAEAFDQDRIWQVLGTRPGLDRLLFDSNFRNPLLICYYLFFPARIAQLEGCDDTQIGPRFASFAGEWACVTVLLNRLTDASPYLPRFLGLTSRNIGKLEFQDEDRRVGMTVLDWSTVTTASDHPRVFVSMYTHGLYATPGTKLLTPFTPDDAGALNCGISESLDELAEYPEMSTGASLVISIGKTFSIVGIPSAIAEWLNGDLSQSFQGVPGPTPAQYDHPPNANQYGVVVSSPAIPLPDADGAQLVLPWFFDPVTGMSALTGSTVHETTVGDRRYSFMVDRRETDPSRRQVWWPSDSPSTYAGATAPHVGYNGRWGPQVENDPRGRRSGMRFPNFAQLFLRALQKTLLA
jgi:hypothetical protein